LKQLLRLGDSRGNYKGEDRRRSKVGALAFFVGNKFRRRDFNVCSSQVIIRARRKLRRGVVVVVVVMVVVVVVVVVVGGISGEWRCAFAGVAGR
jgi:hypothetical protein